MKKEMGRIMEKTIINTDKIEVSIGAVFQINRTYTKIVFPLGIDFDYFPNADESKCFGFRLDILCFRFFVEIWKWGEE